MAQNVIRDRDIATTTKIDCGKCVSALYVGEEVVELRLGTVRWTAAGILYSDLFEDGDYLYGPQHFENDCWLSVSADLGDEPYAKRPTGHEQDDAEVRCFACARAIERGELVGLAEHGRLTWAERAPFGPTFVFEKRREIADYVCCICLIGLNKAERLWSEVQPVPGREICKEGLTARCWRTGDCECECH